MMLPEKSRIVFHLERFGLFCLFVRDTFVWTFRRPVRIKLFASQVEHMGVASVPIILLSSLATGMIMSLQMVDILRLFNAGTLAGPAVGLTMSRELAPIITALMLIAKNGSAITAEIGTMRISEQIDAMETMSVNPVHFLVVPRVWAAVVVFPVLTAMANVVGVIGSYIVSVWIKGIDSAGFLYELFRMVNPKDIYSGIIKAVVLGFLVGVISCFFGYYVRGGSKAVGDAATHSVVVASVSVLVADYIMTDILLKVFI